MPEELDAGDRADADRDLADPRDRQRRQGRLGRLPQAGHHRRHAVGLGRGDGGRPETDTPDFTEIAPPFGELYANPAASQAMLDDAAFDVEAWLASEIATEFARAEGAAFVAGNGTNRPKGFLAAPTSDDGGRRPRRSGRCSISRPASPAAFRRRTRRTS